MSVDMKAFAREVADAVNERLRPLEARLSALEQTQKSFAYKGTWKAGTVYAAGECITDAGALWYCKQGTTSRPPGPHWTLSLKSGEARR